MNGRKAKHLRKMAQAESVGIPALEYHDYQIPQFFPMPDGTFKVSKGVPLRMKFCTRWIYKKMKKQAA
jgi:hypothetical protein